MSQEPSEKASARDRTPWSPFSVAMIALFLPAGAAVLTVRNLERLGQIESRRARELTAAVVVIFAIGITALLVTSRRSSANPASFGADSSWILSAGVALASYVIQRAPFMTWRSAHTETRTGGWMPAIGIAVLYQLITLSALIPVVIIMVLTGNAGHA